MHALDKDGIFHRLREGIFYLLHNRRRYAFRADDTEYHRDGDIEAEFFSHDQMDLVRRFVAERAVPLANGNWGMVTWQEPGADDVPTRIKTWVLLREAAGGRAA